MFEQELRESLSKVSKNSMINYYKNTMRIYSYRCQSAKWVYLKWASVIGFYWLLTMVSRLGRGNHHLTMQSLSTNLLTSDPSFEFRFRLRMLSFLSEIILLVAGASPVCNAILFVRSAELIVFVSSILSRYNVECLGKVIFRHLESLVSKLAMIRQKLK